MDKNQVKELLEKFNEGRASDQELRLLEHWFSKETELNDSDLPVENNVELLQEMWQQVYRSTSPAPKPQRIKLWSRIAIAGSIALALSIAGYLFFNNQETKTNSSAFATTVAPGVNGATLTLSNGRKIKLSDAINGELAEEAGVAITKSADGELVYELKGSSLQGDQINTLTTARGETYQVRLPDGSSVWLNAESSISYTATLNDKGLRTVRLNGEAYFEVAHNAEKPFRVLSKGQMIEVLGTKFNINTYADEPAVRTALIEGSVKVVSLSLSKTETLKPGQQSLLSINNNSIKVEKVDIEEAIAWKNGYFNLNNENIQDVMRKLARWYDIEVEYKGKLPDIVLGGEIPRNTKLSEALKILEVANVHFIIEGKKITVVP